MAIAEKATADDFLRAAVCAHLLVSVCVKGSEREGAGEVGRERALCCRASSSPVHCFLRRLENTTTNNNNSNDSNNTRRGSNINNINGSSSSSIHK